eukprot:7087255-Pyramimonas_sp.AAC.1
MHVGGAKGYARKQRERDTHATSAAAFRRGTRACGNAGASRCGSEQMRERADAGVSRCGSEQMRE